MHGRGVIRAANGITLVISNEDMKSWNYEIITKFGHTDWWSYWNSKTLIKTRRRRIF